MTDEQETIQPEEQKGKISLSFRHLWDNIVRCNSYSWSPRREKSERLEKNIFENKMAKKPTSNFMKNTLTLLKKLSKHLLG